MTFYNPNIQSAFDADEHAYIELRNRDLASYTIVYKINEGCSVSAPDDIKAGYQVRFLRYENDTLQQNLKSVHSGFDFLLAEIALEVFIGHVNTFEDFLNFNLQFTPSKEINNVLYIGDFIQDFIELLVYSDIAENKPASGVRDFTKLLGVSSAHNNKPVFYNLYDRLKLYARLRKEIQLEIDRKNVLLAGRELTIELRLCV